MKIAIKDLLKKMQTYADSMGRIEDLEEEIEYAKENDRRSVPSLQAQLDEAKAEAQRLGNEVV